MLEAKTDVGVSESEGISFSQSIPITENIGSAFTVAESVASNFGATTGLTEADIEEISVGINQGTTNAFRFSEGFEYLGQTAIPLKVTNKQGEELALTFADFNGNGIWDYDEGLETEPVIIATVLVEKNIQTALLGSVQPISDFLGVFEEEFPGIGPNSIHPDHHYLITIPIDEEAGSFYILMANDGGLAFSKDNGQSFRQTGVTGPRPEDFRADNFKGYNTSQFYGIDKMNGSDRYIGGTQDNGVWISPENPTETSDWVIAPSGDGMETAWHYLNSDWILQTSQENELRKSIDGGNTWKLVELPPNTGPFITRLSNSKQEPDFVCMISTEGLLKSYDFGDTWEMVPLPIPKSSRNTPTEISLASPTIVWTGYETEALAVSEDIANSFKLAKGYDQAVLGSITSINTHPFNPRKAYITYSIADGPNMIPLSYGQEPKLDCLKVRIAGLVGTMRIMAYLLSIFGK